MKAVEANNNAFSISLVVAPSKMFLLNSLEIASTEVVSGYF